MLPIRLEITNFKSHSHSVIDFDFSSALIIGEKSGDPRRSNGSGKSSILESISFALYSETGDKNSDDIVKKGQPVCEVILDFMHDDQKYQVKRTRNAKYSKVITEFWKILDDGSREKLHGDTNKITDQIICDTIKCSYDVFLNSVYFRQGSFFDFAQGTFSTRQALLGSLLNLDDWAKYQKLSKAKFDKLEAEIEAMRAILLQTENASAQLAENVAEFAVVNQKIEAINQENVSIEEQIKSLEDALMSDSERGHQAAKAKDLNTESQRLTKELERLSSLNAKHESTITDLKSSIASSKNAIEEKSDQIKKLTKELSDIDLESKKSNIIKMEGSLVEGKAKARQIKSQIEVLSNGDKCTTCGHEWLDHDNKQTEISHRKLELEGLSSKISRAESKILTAKSEMETLRLRAIELDKLKLQLDNISDSLQTTNLRASTAEGQRSSLLEEILLTEKRLGDVTTSLKSIKDIDSIASYSEKTEQLTLKKEALKKNRESLKDLFVLSGNLSAKAASLRETIANRAISFEKLNECTKQATVYSRLTKAFGRDGVQAIIIDNVVDELTRATNLWLSEFSSEPMHISFVTQKQGAKGDWKETFDIEINTRNGPQPWYSLSGGEKFIVSFAIRLALGSIQARRMGGETQLLLLDEVSSSLDPYNIDIFVSIIRKLERTMKVLVITHDPALKDEFETIISVKRTHAGSEVVFE